MFSQRFELMLTLVVFMLSMALRHVSSQGNKNRLTRLPLWQSLLIHHHRWSGIYVHDESRFMCSMFVHSLQHTDPVTTHVSFTSQGFHIEMNGISPDNVTVIFKEIHTWNKTGHFEGHTDITFNGAFVPDTAYYKYEANVSSNEAHNYGMVTLIPQGSSMKTSKHDGNKSLSLGMAIGIPLFLGTIVFVLAGFLIVWAVRKGYLRHVPWKYKTFRNSMKTRSGVEMSGEQPEAVTVEGVETTAVHI